MPCLCMWVFVFVYTVLFSGFAQSAKSSKLPFSYKQKLYKGIGVVCHVFCLRKRLRKVFKSDYIDYLDFVSTSLFHLSGLYIFKATARPLRTNFIFVPGIILKIVKNLNKQNIFLNSDV